MPISSTSDGRSDFISTLLSGKAVLVAGAGCSISSGYPSWPALIESLHVRFAPTIALTGGSYLENADIIYASIPNPQGIESYHNHLRNTFSPGSPKQAYAAFHLLLVQLRFCGLVTTNYDGVIEAAVIRAFSRGDEIHSCDPIDLCGDKPVEAFRFLRELSSDTIPRSVLHLHGYYRNPEGMILTGRNYQHAYGQAPAFDAFQRPLHVTLDSLHRKVLWTLATTHPLVFAGFSLDDEFFREVLTIVGRDFRLGEDEVHFAIMPLASDEDRNEIDRFLRMNNTQPIYYSAPIVDGIQNHSEFEKLIQILAEGVGVSTVTTGLNDLNRRMLEL